MSAVASAEKQLALLYTVLQHGVIWSCAKEAKEKMNVRAALMGTQSMVVNKVYL